MKKNNAVVYARVSTDEQAIKGYSIENQERQALDYIKRKGYNLVNLYKEDYSAKDFDNRPEWKKLMNYLKANKGKVQSVIISKWDRFSRNLFGTLEMTKILGEMGIIVECIDQPIDYDNPDALISFAISAAMAEAENRKISLRTTAGMRQASLNGCWVGKPPLGYQRDWVIKGTVTKNATLKPDSNSIIVEKIFQYFTIHNLSADSIRNKIYSEYGRKISKQGVLDILKNVCYVGKVKIKKYKSEPEIIVKGYHLPIISDEVFQEAQQIMIGKKRMHLRKDNREAFPLKEIIRCSVCGLSFTASITTKKRGLKKYPYYHCSKTKGHDRYPVQVVHDCFGRVLKQFKVKHEILNLYRAMVIDTINSHNKEVLAEKRKIEQDLEKVRSRIKNAEDLLADGIENKEVCLSMLKRFRDEEDMLIMKHATLKSEAMPKVGDVEYLLALFNSFDVLYSLSDYPLKKKIVSSIFPKPVIFSKDHFRTEQVSPLLELLILNSNNLQGLKIETSHFKSGSSSSAPPVGLEPTTL
jgi:site-specific DNA recombinase